MSDTKGYLKREGINNIYSVLPPIALTVTVSGRTCSSVTISSTSGDDNENTDFLIIYDSSIHEGFVNYRPETSPPYTTKLTNLVADTEYIIEVIDKHIGNTTTNSDTIHVRTIAGTESEEGMYYLYT